MNDPALPAARCYPESFTFRLRTTQIAQSIGIPRHRAGRSLRMSDLEVSRCLPVASVTVAQKIDPFAGRSNTKRPRRSRPHTASPSAFNDLRAGKKSSPHKPTPTRRSCGQSCAQIPSLRCTPTLVRTVLQRTKRSLAAHTACTTGPTAHAGHRKTQDERERSAAKASPRGRNAAISACARRPSAGSNRRRSVPQDRQTPR